LPLIDSQGRVVADHWTWALTETECPAVSAIVPLERLPGLLECEPDGRRLGVFLPAGTQPEAVVPYLDRIDVIAVEFPKFRDGRGFSLARSLREHHHFHGEIRAVGHVLPDQYAALVGVGFTTVQVPEGQAVERWADSLSVPGGHGKKRVSQLFGRLVGHPAEEGFD